MKRKKNTTDEVELGCSNSPFERSQMSLDQNSDMILFHTHLFSREVPDSNEPQLVFFVVEPTSVVTAKRKQKKELCSLYLYSELKSIMMERASYSSFVAYNCASSFGMLQEKYRYGSFDK